MAVKIESVNLRRGEHIIVTFNGSKEHAICVSWRPGMGDPIVLGPMNCKSKRFSVSLLGMELLKKEM